jgi:hypothetical protein
VITGVGVVFFASQLKVYFGIELNTLMRGATAGIIIGVIVGVMVRKSIKR